MPSFSNYTAIFFLCMLCFLSLSTKVISQDHPLSYCHNNSPTYTPNSTYRANLNLLLSTLSSNPTSHAIRDTGYYNFTVGRDTPDMVYGLFLCRGDVTPNDCRDCVATASREILRLCPNQTRSVVWYDNCMLRYSDQSTIPDRSTWVRLTNTGNVKTEVDRFDKAYADVMIDIATRAANDQSGKKFATREAKFTPLLSVYGLAQCTPDLSSSDCSSCLQDCISNLVNCCSRSLGARLLFETCNLRYELYSFYRIVGPAPVPPPSRRLPPPPPGSPGSDGISSPIIVAIVIAIIVSMVLLTIGLCFLTWRKSKMKYKIIREDQNTGKTKGEKTRRKRNKTVVLLLVEVEPFTIYHIYKISIHLQLDADPVDITKVELLQYDFSTIKAATNTFSDDNKIGEGGFGVVYKGTFPNGQEIAVKRLSRISGQGSKEFKNEVVLVTKLQHRNLVRLLGFCLEGEEKIVIYEYVANKSLDYYLFDPEKQEMLDWSRRYKIIEGIARGILYLHEDSGFRIIHRDLKASNILLDGDLNAKISDFGMARFFGGDESQRNTSRMVGTYGYMSPEYVMHGQFSVKSDVFSFGVLILEIISGKKNSSFYQSNCSEYFLSYAWRHWRDGTPLELMDPALGDSYNRSEVIRCIHIGLLCVQEDLDDRPTMASIVMMLNSNSHTMQLPHEPAFYFRTRTDSSMLKELESEGSINETSITEIHPRYGVRKFEKRPLIAAVLTNCKQDAEDEL